jgi:branched-chain amino acid transport system ATP-binding protein
MLTIEHLDKSFFGTSVITDLNLRLLSGEIVSVIGPNGSGKTTLLNLISGAIRPDRGQILLDRCNLEAVEPVRIANLGVARLWQDIGLFDDLTALENVVLGFRTHGRWKILSALLRPMLGRETQRLELKRALDFLDRMGFPSVSYPSKAAILSYGQRKLVAAARMLASEPRIVLADEPFAGLDSTGRTRLITQLRDLSAKGAAVILVEHERELLNHLSHRLLVFERGGRWREDELQAVVNEGSR